MKGRILANFRSRGGGLWEFLWSCVADAKGAAESGGVCCG